MSDFKFKHVVAAFEMEAGDAVIIVRRTLAERFLSWPWRPWVSEKAEPLLPKMKDRAEAVKRAMQAGLDGKLFS